MPVIPTFSQTSPPPNLAEAFLGRERLRQEAAADAARISLGYATLQQRAVESEMEVAAKREALANEALRRDHQNQIEKAYRDQQLGLRTRELQNEEAIAAMRIRDAARELERDQGYRRRVTELTGKGMSLEDASRQAILESGGTGLSTALEKPNPPSPFPSLNFQFKQLEAQKQDLLRPYQGLSFVPANVRSNVAEITRQQSLLTPPSTMTGTNAPAPVATATNAPVTRVVRDSNGKLVIQR